MRVANLQLATGVIVAGLMASACDRQTPVEPDGPLFHEVQPQHDVSVQAIVSITQVAFDRFGQLGFGGSGASGGPQIAVSITCGATGVIGDLDIRVEQRGRTAHSNMDLQDAPCTTVPTRFVFQLDCFSDCEFFRPGRLDVIRATEFPSGNEFGAGQVIILRDQPVL